MSKTGKLELTLIEILDIQCYLTFISKRIEESQRIDAICEKLTDCAVEHFTSQEHRQAIEQHEQMPLGLPGSDIYINWPDILDDGGK